MDKKSKTHQGPADINEIAFRVFQQAVSETPSPAKNNTDYVALGSRGGKVGGPARAAKLSPEQRREIAQAAATARWKKSS